MKASLSILLCLLLTSFASGCGVQETKGGQADKATTSNDDREPKIVQVPLTPGAQKPVVDQSAEGRHDMNDPEAIAQGKQLFAAMNCSGCHFNGGGGIGPPLMDSEWIYGDSIENIAATIREGRPNGMPSFRGFLPDEQIWQVAAYVRSLSHPLPGSASAQPGK